MKNEAKIRGGRELAMVVKIKLERERGLGHRFESRLEHVHLYGNYYVMETLQLAAIPPAY